MIYFPVNVQKQYVQTTRECLLVELRNRTRAPYYDNLNNRRLDIEDKKLFLTEFDDFLFLKNEIIGNRFITPKTLIHIKPNQNGLKLLTISYPGGVGGFIQLAFAIGLPFIVIASEDPKEISSSILLSLFLLVFLTFANRSAYKSQLNILQQTIAELEK